MGKLRGWMLCALLLVARPVRSDDHAAALRQVAKPSDDVAVQLASRQPTLPDGVSEIPWSETAPVPVLTPAETQRGYLLFQRPIVDCVYPNTRPLPHERVEGLTAFATPGEFESVTLALYPVRALKNLKVRASSLVASSGRIPADRVDIRLATFWNVGYPAYSSRKTFRRAPELLERVSVHTSPAQECQQYWLTVHVPDDAQPDLYRGTVTVWDDGYEHAVEVPLTLRVLGFHLKKDPRKHNSTYFYARNKTLYKGRDEAFIRKAADNDYRAMRELGLDILPTMHLNCTDGMKLALSDSGELNRMLAAGLHGPLPVTADNAIGRLYRDMVPGGRRGGHWSVKPLPPEAFYSRITTLFQAFERERKAKGWPEIICCPLDEVDVSHSEFGSKVYQAVKAAGVRTFATKDPIGADAATYAPYVDVFCSQPYSMSYDRIVSQSRHEYWCYPNHNANEIRDAQTMCKGGRMTYGYGFWRSGYTTLIPWHWSRQFEPDPADYLRGASTGCGQRVDDDAEVIPAIYWVCFREGSDDARYLYTLQQAIVQRVGSKEAACQAEVARGRRILQETWDAIRVQPKYLSDGMWSSDDFNAIRWRLAAQTERLHDFPATSDAVAPSVLVERSAGSSSTGEPASPYESPALAATLERLDLSEGFTGWQNATKEGKVEISEVARRSGDVGLRWTIGIDHERDGGEGGKYPVGWPRLETIPKPACHGAVPMILWTSPPQE